MLTGVLLFRNKKLKSLRIFLIVFSTMLLAGILILMFSK